MNWKLQYIANVNDDCTLTVTQTDTGWHWEGVDHMAWQSKETHGEGDASSFALAQAKAEHWFTTGRFE